MGYKLAGCEVLGCCEIDPKMNEVYIKNHHPKYNFLMDIRAFNELPNDEIPQELFNLDILDGSPPCTTFSMAGKREESWGKKKKFREGQAEQTLDDLSFVFIDTVAKLRPKVVIMENVEGLIKGEAWGYVQKIYKQLYDTGYKVNHWLLKGEKMGVPQTRHRVFFVATKNNINVDLKRIDMNFNYQPVLFSEVKQGIGKPAKCYNLLLKARPGDASLADVLIREEGRNSRFNERLVWDNFVAPTIRSGGGLYRANDKTKMTDEDYRNCQTFPVDYNFCDFNVEYICGMSVPPLMMKRLVTRLIEQGLFDYKNERI